MHQEQRDARSALHECHFGLWCKWRVSAYGFKAASEEPLVMVRIGAPAFDGVDRHGRINPDGSEMRGDSVENKQVELIMSEPLVPADVSTRGSAGSTSIPTPL